MSLKREVLLDHALRSYEPCRPAERSLSLSEARAAHAPALVYSDIARRSFMKRSMSNKTSCARRAGCLPLADVVVVTGDPSAGRGRLATSRPREATQNPECKGLV